MARTRIWVPLIEHSGHGSIKACAAKAREAPGGRNWEVTMKLARRDFLYFAGTAIAGMAVPTLAWTESYPSRSVREIVPFAPGGVTDVTARLVASKLSEQFGKQFYVENLGGRAAILESGKQLGQRRMELRYFVPLPRLSSIPPCSKNFPTPPTRISNRSRLFVPPRSC